MISMYNNNIIESTSINVDVVNNVNNKKDDELEIEHELSLNIPKLTDILNDKIPVGSAYSNYNFTQFLITKHCVENLYFYNEIMTLLEDYDNFQINNWLAIYRKFIECDDINLPGDLLIKLDKNKNKLPCINLLMKIKKIIMGYLHNSFHEFLNELKIEKFSCLSSMNSVSLCSSPCSTSLTSDEIDVNDAQTEVSVNTSCSLSTKNNVINIKDNTSRRNNEYNNDHDIKNSNTNNAEINNTNNTNKNNTTDNVNEITDRKKEKGKDDIDAVDINTNTGTNTTNTKSWNKLTNKFKWKRRTSSSSSC